MALAAPSAETDGPHKPPSHFLIQALFCLPEPLHEPGQLHGTLRLGGLGRSVAPEIHAILQDQRLTLGHDNTTNAIQSVTILDEERRDIERADCIMHFEDGTTARFWLPDDFRWQRAMALLADVPVVVVPSHTAKGYCGAEASALSDMEIDALCDTLEELPDGWLLAQDDITGRQYYYSAITGETAWQPPFVDLDEAWRQSAQEEGSIEELLELIRTCPLYDHGDRLAHMVPTVIQEASGDPELVKKRLCQLCADLKQLKKVPSVLEALVDCIDYRELPFNPKAARCVALERLARFLLSADHRRKTKKFLATFPRKTIAAMARIGVPLDVVASSLVTALFATKFNKQNLIQRMAAASLGIGEAVKARDACLTKLGHQHLNAHTLASLPDDALLDASRVFENGDIPPLATRALDLEAFIRRSRRIVDAYGHPDYIDVCKLAYPALLKPLAHLVQAYPNILDSCFDIANRILLIWDEHDDDLFVKLRKLDDQLGRAMDLGLSLAHRLALTKHTMLKPLTDWLFAPATEKEHQDQSSLPYVSYLRVEDDAQAWRTLEAYGYLRVDLAFDRVRLYAKVGSTGPPISKVRLHFGSSDDLPGWLSAGPPIAPRQNIPSLLFGAKHPTLFYLRASSQEDQADAAKLTLDDLLAFLHRYGYCI